MLEQRARDQVASDLNGVANMLDVFNAAMVNDAASYARQFATYAPGPFELDGGQLSANGKAVNNDFSIPDNFTAQTGAIATIFAADGADFVRVTTSVKKEDGQRAVGTKLDHNNPSYAMLREGRSYTGLAQLFGKPYITQYDPVKDASGKVVGVLFIGLDISKNIAALKDKIKGIRIGETGYVYVLNAAAGKGLRHAAGPPFQGRCADARHQGQQRQILHPGDAGKEDRRDPLHVGRHRQPSLTAGKAAGLPLLR